MFNTKDQQTSADKTEYKRNQSLILFVSLNRVSSKPNQPSNPIKEGVKYSNIL
jgi:hypothetical protein